MSAVEGNRISREQQRRDKKSYHIGPQRNLSPTQAHKHALKKISEVSTREKAIQFAKKNVPKPKKATNSE